MTISRILLSIVIYLGHVLPHISLAALQENLGTALHSGKDLAVSPHTFPHKLLPKESLFFRSGRLCSHLVGCPRWELPTTLLRIAARVSGLSSLHYCGCVTIRHSGHDYTTLLDNLTSSRNTCQLFLHFSLVLTLKLIELTVIKSIEVFREAFKCLLVTFLVRCKAVHVIVSWKE